MTELRCSVEVREDVERRGPGRLVGTLVRFGDTAQTRRGAERIAPGALTWPKDDGIIINRQHNRNQPVMRAMPVEDREGIHIDAPIPDSIAGRDLAEELRAGVFGGLSVEMVPNRTEHRGGAEVVTRGRLVRAAVVDTPAYPQSTVEVRNRGAAHYPAAWL